MDAGRVGRNSGSSHSPLRHELVARPIVIPLATQHYMLLQRNLIYTGITRGKKLVVLVGQKKALNIAVYNDRPQRRYSGLFASLRGHERHRDFIK
jgi:ATP-dependent exoDNAse (exonuclease V) alpha subunit